MEVAFYPRCHSSGSDLDIASKRNSQRAGHVRVLFVRHHPFLIEGCPIYCLCFILYRSSVVFSGANLPLGQIADENSADGAQVFICIIRVVYCTAKSSFPRMMHHRDMFLDFI